MGVLDLEKGIESCYIADRNFNVSDRVRAWYKGEWYEGTVVEKIIPKPRFAKVDPKIPFITIKTDKKIDDDPKGSINGYELYHPVSQYRDPVLFLHEKVPEGDEIYRTLIEFVMNPEELRRMRKEQEEFEKNMPF